jgi:hypothetical protein
VPLIGQPFKNSLWRLKKKRAGAAATAIVGLTAEKAKKTKTGDRRPHQPPSPTASTERNDHTTTGRCNPEQINFWPGLLVLGDLKKAL